MEFLLAWQRYHEAKEEEEEEEANEDEEGRNEGGV